MELFIKIRLLAIFFASLFYATALFSQESNTILRSVIEEKKTIEHKKQLSKKYSLWINLIKKHPNNLVNNKVKLVNDFFNNKKHFDYAQDITIWNTPDYWATPTEFMNKGYGDCEDYAIAKYFTLLALGVPDKSLRITYVNINMPVHGANQDLAHMVLSYHPSKGEAPYVLDNVDTELKSAKERPDLKFLYSFNGEKLWISRNRKQGVYIGSSNRLSKWSAVKGKFNNY